jgi:hypothetical protein
MVYSVLNQFFLQYGNGTEHFISRLFDIALIVKLLLRVCYYLLMQSTLQA